MNATKKKDSGGPIPGRGRGRARFHQVAPDTPPMPPAIGPKLAPAKMPKVPPARAPKVTTPPVSRSSSVKSITDLVIEKPETSYSRTAAWVAQATEQRNPRDMAIPFPPGSITNPGVYRTPEQLQQDAVKLLKEEAKRVKLYKKISLHRRMTRLTKYPEQEFNMRSTNE